MYHQIGSLNGPYTIQKLNFLDYKVLPTTKGVDDELM
jgi:hypothetical protein